MDESRPRDKVVRVLEVVTTVAVLACAGLYLFDWFQRRPAEPDPVDVVGVSRGEADAPVVMVEFSNFECRFCRQFNTETMPQLDRRYVDVGLVRHVYKHFLLGPTRVGAASAVLAACADRQQRFWASKDRLFSSPVSFETIGTVAMDLGLDVVAFDNCRTDADTLVDRDMSDGLAWGVSSTPTFFIGVPAADGKVRFATKLVGAQPVSAFTSVIDGLSR